MDKLRNFPFALIFVFYLLYLGYQFYEFGYSPEGQVEQHKTLSNSNNNEVEGLKKKFAEGQKFLKNIELKKAEIQGLVRKLTEYQGALAEALDVPSTMKLLITEAKKIELRVEKIEPGKKNEKEYYVEQEFKLDVKGTFQQVVLFVQRVSALQRILRIEGFNLKPVTSNSSSANVINAQLSVRAYQYSLSKEDKIGRGEKL